MCFRSVPAILDFDDEASLKVIDLVMNPEMLTVQQSADLKGVTRSAVYLAIKENRLPHVRVLGKIGLHRTDVEAWVPISYRGRPGANARRAKGSQMSEAARGKVSTSQKKRWELRRGTNGSDA